MRFNSKSLWKRLWLVGPVILGLTAAPVHAEYVRYGDSGLDGWLWDRLEDGIEKGAEAGAKAVAKKLLSTLAQALIDYFAPTITDLLFGSDDGMAAHTRRIIAEVRAVHADLVARNRDMLDEIQDEFEADLEGRFTHAVETLDAWSQIENPVMRIDNENSPLIEIIDDLGLVHETIAAYLERRSDNPRIQHRRLQLLTMHMIAAQLEIVGWQLYYSNFAIERAFRAAHPELSELGTWEQFRAWRDALTDEELAAIQEEADAAIPFCESIASRVLAFYDEIAAIDDERAYVDDIFTPVVSHMEAFNGNAEMYDSSAEMNNEGNWDVPDEPCDWDGCDTGYARLDAQRYYYYVNVPGPDCLDGYVFRELIPNETGPWAESLEEPAASECNRFWIVERDWYSDSMPDYNGSQASFDAYDQWFTDSFQVWELHKELVHGDLVLDSYGPASLVLDQLHAQYVGGTRPRNHWDDVIDRYDELVGLLGAGDSYTDAVTASDRLRTECGATIDSVGLELWYGMLVIAVANPDAPIMCQDHLEGNHDFASAARAGAGYHRDLNLNATTDIDVIGFDLPLDNSVLIQLEPGDELIAPPTVELYWQDLGSTDEPELVATATASLEYGWAIVLPADEDAIYRHPAKNAFVKVYSEDGEMGTYNLAIQTRGPTWGSGGGGKCAAASALPTTAKLATTATLTSTKETSSTAAMTLASASLPPVGLDPGCGLPDDGLETVPEIAGAYRLEPKGTGTLTYMREELYAVVKGLIHTGGHWLVSHVVTGLTGGADTDQFVVNVPSTYRMHVRSTSQHPGGRPHVQMDNARESGSVTVVTEPEYVTTVVARPNFGCRGEKDVFFSVTGLFNENYRRDTGPYKLEVFLKPYADFSLASPLCSVKRMTTERLFYQLVDPSDLEALKKWDVVLAVAAVPKVPGDPYVLAAINRLSGKEIGRYEVVAKEVKSPLDFRKVLGEFNAAEMGPATYLAREFLTQK